MYTTLQQYARYLVLEKLPLRGVSVDSIIASIRRLPWAAQPGRVDLEETVTEAFMHMAKNNYMCIPVLADCLSGLVRYVLYIPHLSSISTTYTSYQSYIYNLMYVYMIGVYRM